MLQGVTVGVRFMLKVGEVVMTVHDVATNKGIRVLENSHL
jgi:hypothetical protein